MSKPIAPMIIRGKVITDNLIDVGGRGGDLVFQTPDAHKYIDQLPLGNPAKLADLYTLTFKDILDYCEALGERLEFDKNPYLQEACELSYLTAPVTPSMVKGSYMGLRHMLTRESVTEQVENSVGVKYLEGWVKQRLIDGTELDVRCFGARTLHIVAGNATGLVAADHPAQHGAAQRRDHQGAVQRPVHRPGHRPHHGRDGAGPPADQTPQRRLLERRRPGVRRTPVPAAEPGEDRCLGRLQFDEARHPLHPAGPGADLPRPETQRQHHRQGRLRQ